MTNDKTEAQYQEVRAWVDPQAWRDESVAEHVIESILASGSDDMDVRMLFVHIGEIAEARAQLTEALELRDEQIRVLYAKGFSMAWIAHLVDVSVNRIQQIIASGTSEDVGPEDGYTVEG